MNQDNSNSAMATNPSSNNNSNNILINFQLAQLLASSVIAPARASSGTAAESDTSTPKTDIEALLALIQQQQGQPGTLTGSNLPVFTMDLESCQQAQAVLKHHEDKLRATRLLLQQQEQEGNMQRDPILFASTAMAAAKAAQKSILGGFAGGSGVTTELQAEATRGTMDPKIALLLAHAQGPITAAATAAADEEAKEDDEEAKSAMDSDEEKESEVDTDNDQGYDDKMSDNEYFESFSTTDDNRVIQETFPLKLYRMLHEVDKIGKQNIVSFLPHGRSFVVHKPKAFVEDVMPKYFTTCRLASFQRQLNLYGFRRITEGREKGAYTHDYFLKGKRALCRKVKRQKTRVKATQHHSFGALASLTSANSNSASLQELNQAASLPSILAGSNSAHNLASLQASLGIGGPASALLGGLSGSSLPPARLVGASSGDVSFSVLQEALRRGLLAGVNSARQQETALNSFLITQQLQNQLQEQEAEVLLQRLRQQQQPDPQGSQRRA